MSIIDLVILFILVFFTYHGLKKGLIRSLGNLVALIFGAYFASHFYLKFFEWGSVWVKDHEALGKVLAFIILFIAATQLVNFVFFLIEKIFNLIAFIPGSKYINNLLGGVLALLEGSLFLGLIIFVASRYAVIDTTVSYTHLRAHETVLELVCRLLLEKKKNTTRHIRTLP